MVVLRAGAALHLAQSPGSVSEAFKHVHPDADAVVFESGLENRGNTLIGHQGGRSGDRLRMLPRLFVDQRAAGKQQMRLAADLLPDVHRGARRRVPRKAGAHAPSAIDGEGTAGPRCNAILLDAGWSILALSL